MPLHLYEYPNTPNQMKTGYLMSLKGKKINKTRFGFFAYAAPNNLFNFILNTALIFIGQSNMFGNG